jgi:hypothetical protein
VAGLSLASERTDLTTPNAFSDANPPSWAEVLVRLFLAPRDRDTVTGDLLEEYREVAVPTILVIGLGTTPSFDLRLSGPGQAFGQSGGQATLVLLMLRTVPGTIGAMFGRGVGGVLRRRTEAADERLPAR